MPFLKAHMGQSLTEYVLCALAVLGVSISALSFLGIQLNISFSNMIPGPTSTHSTKASSASNQAVNIQNGVGIQPVVPNNLDPLAGAIDIPATVQIAGVNGTTKILADQILKIAKENYEVKKISDDEYNDIAALAKQGHIIANIEKGFEQIASQAKSKTDFNLLLAQAAASQKMTTDEYVNQLGYINGLTDPRAVKDPLDRSLATGETGNFIELYNNLQGSNRIPREILSSLSQLSNHIGYLSEVSVDTVLQIQGGDILPVQGPTVSISNVTHLDSTKICDIGGNSTKCQ